MTKRLPLALAVAAAAALPVAAATAGPATAGAPTAAAAATHVVKLENIRISPSRLTVHRGDRVTWQFLDAKIMAEHTVTPRGSLRFKGASARMSGSYSVTFAKRGTYLYECAIHPNMQGRIIVR